MQDVSGSNPLCSIKIEVVFREISVNHVLSAYYEQGNVRELVEQATVNALTEERIYCYQSQRIKSICHK